MLLPSMHKTQTFLYNTQTSGEPTHCSVIRSQPVLSWLSRTVSERVSFYMLLTEVKNSFEIQVRDHPSIILVAKNAEEKNNWMAALISLLTRRSVQLLLQSINCIHFKQIFTVLCIQ